MTFSAVAGRYICLYIWKACLVFEICSLKIAILTPSCVPVLWVFSDCSPSTLWVFSESAPSVLWLLFECSLSVLWVFSGCALGLLLVLSKCALSQFQVLHWYCSDMERVLCSGNVKWGSGNSIQRVTLLDIQWCFSTRNSKVSRLCSYNWSWI